MVAFFAVLALAVASLADVLIIIFIKTLVVVVAAAVAVASAAVSAVAVVAAVAAFIAVALLQVRVSRAGVETVIFMRVAASGGDLFAGGCGALCGMSGAERNRSRKCRSI